MKTKLISMLLLFSINAISQNFHQVGPEVILDEEDVSQTKIQSYIYLNNSTDYNIIKNDIYSFFDPQINQNPQDYDPATDITTSYMFVVYKNTAVLDENFVFDENADNAPLIDNHNNDIIAVVNYSISSNNIKSIFFYQNKILIKRFFKNQEKTLTTDIINRLNIDSMF